MKEIDAPVISVVAQGEAMASLRGRKADSAKYRHYEVAVASHIDTHAYAGFPSFEDQTKVGSVQGTPQWMFTARCEPEIVFQDLPLLGYVFNAAFENLHRWVKDGVAAPNAPRLATENNQIVVDEFGIARGGIRSPYSEAPTARYTHTTRGGGVCREMGTTTPLPWSRLEAMYGNHKNYVQKASAAIDKMLAERFVTESDAKRMRAELLQ
jgi:hypothetical protein